MACVPLFLSQYINLHHQYYSPVNTHSLFVFACLFYLHVRMTPASTHEAQTYYYYPVSKLWLVTEKLMY